MERFWVLQSFNLAHIPNQNVTWCVCVYLVDYYIFHALVQDLDCIFAHTHIHTLYHCEII